jgi:DNA ligase-1
MNLYTIVKSLQAAQGNINKQAILDFNKDNALFKSYMKATYDVSLNYYQKKIPKTDVVGARPFDAIDISSMRSQLAERVFTGKAAINALRQNYEAINAEGQELLSLMIDRSIGASVGDTMVLKTWPDLYFIPPYQRCSLMDTKAKERFGKLKKFYVQTKMDGSFAYIVKRMDGTVDVITRQGGTYPKSFAEKMAYGLKPGNVMVGELEVYQGYHDERQLLDRKTGNGILNSILKDGELPVEYQVQCTAWDMLTEAEFVAGKSTRKYSDRLDSLKYELGMLSLKQIVLVHTWEVDSLAAAYVIYTDHTSRGLEGCVAKDPDSLWKDGTAKDIVKMKLKFEAEYRCVGLIEGEGKAKGMAGAAMIETEDGLLECNCGTGFSDKQRKDFWNNPDLIVQQVVMLSANDIIQSRDTRKKPALSLPVFEEVRYDKKSVGANTLAEVQAILQAAKDGN